MGIVICLLEVLYGDCNLFVKGVIWGLKFVCERCYMEIVICMLNVLYGDFNFMLKVLYGD
jgi:hypothetical protein